MPAILPNTAPGHEAGAARVVVVEDPADELTDREKAWSRPQIGIFRQRE
jgi:hypothetical protein